MRASLLVVGLAGLFAIAGACAKGDALDGFETDGEGGSGGRNTSNKSSSSGLSGPGQQSSANNSNASTGTNSPTSNTSSQASSVVSSSNNSTAVSSSSGGPIDCDPENPAPECGANQHCVPQPVGDPVCDPAGAGTQYQLCPNGRSECAPIYECIFDGSDQCCMRWCQVNNDNCGGFEICTGFQTPVYVDGVEYGACWDGYPCVL